MGVNLDCLLAMLRAMFLDYLRVPFVNGTGFHECDYNEPGYKKDAQFFLKLLSLRWRKPAKSTPQSHRENMRKNRAAS